MALQGTLDTFALPDVLRLLAATKKTGRLRISGPRGAGSAWVDGGAVAGVEASHAPHATEPVDALFELLRFEEGSFTFEPDVLPDATDDRLDVETMVEGAEALLREWREIESVVPSMRAWVRLRRHLDDSVTVDPAAWTTLVAVGSGATVSDIADRLELAELPVSRAVRDLLELGVAELAPEAPEAATPVAAPLVEEPVIETPPLPEVEAEVELAPHAAEPDLEPPARRFASPAELAGADEPAGLADLSELAGSAELADLSESADLSELPERADEDEADAPLPIAAPIRARRARGLSRLGDDDGEREPQRFVPLELPGGLSGSYDGPVAGGAIPMEGSEPGVEDLAAAFPGLANRSASAAPELLDDEVARQLATLSPRAAEAVRAAAAAATEEEREAALEAATADADEPVSRGLLLKFLSSVKG